jgi:CheY-like chemotaxis protein
MSMRAKDTYSVLVADDSADDRFLLKAAMRRATRLKLIGEVGNGLQAIAYLKGHGGFADRARFPLPDLLLLDLKMPVKDGFEVLEWLRKQDFEHLTVVVLTESMNPDHIMRALNLGADLFQVKPRGFRERETMILALEQHLLRPATANPVRQLPVYAS